MTHESSKPRPRIYIDLSHKGVSHKIPFFHPHPHPPPSRDCVITGEVVKDVMLNLFQHLIKSTAYETLKWSTPQQSCGASNSLKNSPPPWWGRIKVGVITRSIPPHPNPLPPGERVGHSSPQQSWGVFWHILINSGWQNSDYDTVSKEEG
jgi:hypothetical protein